MGVSLVGPASMFIGFVLVIGDQSGTTVGNLLVASDLLMVGSDLPLVLFDLPLVDFGLMGTLLHLLALMLDVVSARGDLLVMPCNLAIVLFHHPALGLDLGLMLGSQAAVFLFLKSVDVVRLAIARIIPPAGLSGQGRTPRQTGNDQTGQAQTTHHL